MLPALVAERLRAHLAEVKGRHEQDLAHGCGRVVLPFALDRKYPNAPVERAWQFVFPATRICRDPRYVPPSRYHLHESVVQRAVAAAATRSATPSEPGRAGREEPVRSAVSHGTGGPLAAYAAATRASRRQCLVFQRQATD